jgi:hypothetical protein
MSFYFSKYFGKYNLEVIDYWLCPACNFVASKTHFDLPQDAWESLNLEFHLNHNAREDNPYNRRQRLFNQAQMLHLLVRHKIIPDRPWLDWGSGNGDLSMQLNIHFGLGLENFDKYIIPKISPITGAEIAQRIASFELVVNTGVFEHIRSRQTLDEIESYTTEAGSLAIHTLIRNEIPNDPEWMYLLPVHTAFHTNKSMQVLMNSWGYQCSVYNEQAKLWVLFRQNPEKIQPLVQNLNALMGWEYLHYKKGFMDYWQ